VYGQYHPHGVEFIGLTEEDASALEESKEFLEACGVEWPNGYGAAKPSEALRVQGLPTMFVFGPKGKVLWHDEMGGSVEEALNAALWLRDHPEQTEPGTAQN
jgi:hypothetical protein